MAIKVTSNNREREFITLPDDDMAYLQAYGRTFPEHEVHQAPDELRALGWDAYYPDVVTNAGSAGIALRWFNRDGHELDGYVAGWYVMS